MIIMQSCLKEVLGGALQGKTNNTNVLCHGNPAQDNLNDLSIFFVIFLVEVLVTFTNFLFN